MLQIVPPPGVQELTPTLPALILKFSAFHAPNLWSPRVLDISAWFVRPNRSGWVPGGLEGMALIVARDQRAHRFVEAAVLNDHVSQILEF